MFSISRSVREESGTTKTQMEDSVDEHTYPICKTVQMLMSAPEQLVQRKLNHTTNESHLPVDLVL